MRPSAPVSSYLPILPIPGTHGFRGTLKTDWWHGASPFLLWLDLQGFYTLNPSRPFVWTTDLNGARFWRRWFRRHDPHIDWKAAGHALYCYLRPIYDDDDTYIPVSHRNLIAHSHGLQVVLYACELGLRINSLVSVMAPVRADMLMVAQRARGNIGFWEHLHSDRSDRIQWWGGIGDGKVGIERRHPLADVNTSIKGAGHSRLLNDPAWFVQWHEQGVLERLRQRAARRSF